MNANVPEGYKTDARGNLIPVANIKEIDLVKDDLVIELVKKAKQKTQELAVFKNELMGDIEAFVQLSAEQYDVKLGGIKGNVRLMSFDGKYKVERSISDTLTFDQNLLAAKALIDECLHDWTTDARPELCALINNAFDVDKQGNLNTGRILGLRKLKIDDVRWLKAMKALDDSITIQCSKSYVRVYERNEQGNYDQINLNVARV
ncbi:DUF3164 family protein [Neisseria sp. Ec49-e6-T10]|uniref:DUF3164 family protein n=1 Tax=Neisseria sp. Ec49-e6-T10 TaxID=3140744 RepID=UPI003EB78921